MEAILNPNRSTTIKGSDRAEAIAPRATEMTRARDLKAGDTVITNNSALVPAYRVVSGSHPDNLNPGRWAVTFDPGRDVPGPGLDWHPGDGSTSHVVYGDAMVERVTDLSDFEMCGVSGLRSLDMTFDGRGVWEVARQVDTNGYVLVRFAGTDNFEPFRPGTVFLVRGRRINKHVDSACEKALEWRRGPGTLSTMYRREGEML